MSLITNPPLWAAQMSPGVWTELVVHQVESGEIETHDDHLVLRTPSNPTYYWGNFLQLLPGAAATTEAEVAGWLERFRSEFPTAKHWAFGLPCEPSPAWYATGGEVDEVFSLTTTNAPSLTDLAAGYTARPVTTPADWAALVDLAMVQNAETGDYPDDEYRPFVEQRTKAREQLVADGGAQFFAAFDGDGEIVASLGIVACGAVGRYQDVGTRADHRKRGIARHLLAVAGHWAFEQGCESLVIVTEVDNPAARLCRAAGFDGTHTDHGILCSNAG